MLYYGRDLIVMKNKPKIPVTVDEERNSVGAHKQAKR